MNQDNKIEDILINGLKIDHHVKSIESVFENKRFSSKINYTPYYQRNYVWDKQKATYFIESILIGTEIPPLVFFKSEESIEVIDGRQRFETIRKFIDLEFALVKSGLSILSVLNKKNFNDLHPDVQEIFRDTKIRIFEFSILNLKEISSYDEDLVKKEIFRRYNSGITPLKRTELEKAIYIEDEITNYFKDKFLGDNTFYQTVIKLLFGKRDMDRIDDIYTIERIMSKIRQLLVVTNIPVKKMSSHGRSLAERYYELFSNSQPDPEEVYDKFYKSISLLGKISSILKKQGSSLAENYLVYESLYWAIEIIKKEGSFDDNKWGTVFLEKIAKKIDNGNDVFSTGNPLFYKTVIERYQFISEIFRDEIDINWKFFIDTHRENIDEEINVDNNQLENYVESVRRSRIHKPEPSNETIEDICKKIKRKKFAVRPIYQRIEVINKKKSSSLIESILLGIMIPPIFVFKRNDGTSEVVDGQQRLLSIIGFIGEEFMDENGFMKKSSKNLFKLSGLNILSHLNDKKFSDLSTDLQEKILDFSLPIVTIDQKVNDKFEPIDLFIRLNHKPYPVRENSFEMWNSYIDKNFIENIRENVSKHSAWFYLRDPKHNNRMDNEQCYTILTYLFHKEQVEGGGEAFIKFYQRDSSLNARLKDKNDITKTLEKISSSEEVKKRIMENIQDVENFISALHLLISSNKTMSQEKYKDELSDLLNLKTGRRTMQAFYILWFIIHNASFEKLSNDISGAKDKIRDIFALTREVDSTASFLSEVNSFKGEFANG